MKVLIPLLVPLFLYGRFGSDNNSSTSLSGTVADGYIENATVCFDANGNLACDDNEPTTTTAADGSYSVTATGSVDGLAVIAVVGPDSKDADDNGQTMAEAGKEGFNFMAPAANPAVVSPISTLIQFEIVSNPAISLDDAQNSVKSTLGIDNDDLNLLEYDFVEAAEGGDSFASTIKEVTEVLSSALGDVTKNMADSLSSVRDADDSGMKAFQTGILDMIKEDVITQVISPNGGLVEGASVSSLKAQLKGAFRPGDCQSDGSGANDDCNTSGSLVTGFTAAATAKVKAVKIAAKSGEQTVSDAKAVIENGIIIGSDQNSTYDIDGIKRSAVDGLFVEYIKMSAQGGYEAEKFLVDGSWYDSCGGQEYFEMTMNPENGAWNPGDVPGGHESESEPVFDGGCMNFKTLGKFTQRICMKERDLSGKLITELLCPDGTQTAGENKDDFCNDMDGSTAKFLPGSKGLDVTFSHDYDVYRAYLHSCLFETNLEGCTPGYRDATNDFAAITTVDSLISKYSGGENHGRMGSSCNILFAFDNKQIVMKENTNKLGCGAKLADTAIDVAKDTVEKLNYETKTVGSTKVIIFGVPQFYVENYPDDMAPGMKFFIAPVATGTTLGAITTYGNYLPTGVMRKFSFDTGTEKIGTYQFLDSIIDVQGWDDFPYPTTPSDMSPAACEEAG